MKKTLVALMLAALVAPAFAVEFAATNPAPGQLQINYTLTSGEVLRGMALKVTRTSGDAAVAAGTDVSAPAFNTFVDYAFSNIGYTIGTGHPVAKIDGPGVATFPASTFSLSLGYLDQAGAQGGIVASGAIVITLTGTAESCFDVEIDTLRGGIVGDAIVAPTVTKVSQCVPFVPNECVKSTAPFYADWASFGKPNCWCYARNCKGDADGKYQGITATGIYYVGGNDLAILISAWQVKEAPKGPGILSVVNGICADFARDKQGIVATGIYRVGGNDLAILTANWQIKEAPKGPGVADCGTTNYNFFVNP